MTVPRFPVSVVPRANIKAKGLQAPPFWRSLRVVRDCRGKRVGREVVRGRRVERTRTRSGRYILGVEKEGPALKTERRRWISMKRKLVMVLGIEVFECGIPWVRGGIYHLD